MVRSSITLSLTLALAAASTHAATTVMDTPLPFSIYKDGSKCDDTKKLATAIISSVTALSDEGHFCERTIQFDAITGEEQIVYTKVVFSSCDAMSTMGHVFLDAYACADADCGSCTDTNGIPVPASLVLPDYAPLPATDACWGIKADSTKVTVLNQFDAEADKVGVEKYWKVYTDNSCVKDKVSALQELQSSAVSSFPSALALATSAGAVAASFLW
mmetsp:Transcript_22234/g.61923  ORF Transcript_22234/g.61923 Transcript_22234/m.61923 type:complete len:216 (+) Transcript_22234:675-1322(+)